MSWVDRTFAPDVGLVRQLGKYLDRVLAESRRAPPIADRGGGQVQRAGGRAHPPTFWPGHFGHRVQAQVGRQGKSLGVVLTTPAGTPLAVISATQAAAGRLARAVSSTDANSTRWATRAAFVANRESTAAPAMPSTSHNAPNCRSLATATTSGRSAAASVSYGVMLGCRLPNGPGTTAAVR